MSDPETTHIDQSIPIEWHAVEFDGRTVVIRDVPEGTAELFLVTAVSRNVRVLAKADAVLYNGKVVRPYYDDSIGCVDFVHDWGGTVDTIPVVEWLDEPAIRLKKLPTSPPSAVLDAGR